jgi:ABC-2 type transport system permease protein
VSLDGAQILQLGSRQAGVARHDRNLNPVGGIAVGAALHNTAAAIVTYFALAAALSLLMIPALQKAGAWLNTGQTFGWLLAGQWAGHGAQIATSAGLWIVLPMAFGLVRTIRREVR